MMKAADSIVPAATSQMQARCAFLESRFQPKIQMPEERRLQEEGGQALHGQRSAEDVADEARVGRPVHAELELLDEPGDHADGDVDEQQRAEEAGQPAVGVVAVAVPGGLQQRDEEGQPDGDRDEEEVVDARAGELPAGEVEVHGWSLPSIGATSDASAVDSCGRCPGRRATPLRLGQRSGRSCVPPTTRLA